MALFDLPKKEEKLISSYNLKKLDPNKETIALVVSRLVFSEEQNHISGWQKDFVKTVLEPKYNLIFLAVDNHAERFVSMGFSNIYAINSKDFDRFKETKLKRVKELEKLEDIDDKAYVYNKEQVYKEFASSLPQVPVHYVMYLDERFLYLPLKDYFNPKKYSEKINPGNEFHDYIGDDKVIENQVREISKDISLSYDYQVPILTYTYWSKNLILNLGRYYIEKPEFKRSFYFIVDPGSYYALFNTISPNHTTFSLVEDKRGTRNFEKFPIAEMQHYVYENNEKIDKTKNKLFVFYATLFLSKGMRKHLWKKYLKDLRLENSDIFAPPRVDGIIHDKKKEGGMITRFKKKQEKNKEILELWEQVSNHPMYSGYLQTSELNAKIAEYKYAFIPKVIAHNDMSNFRIFLYMALDIFPVVDIEFDPAYLTIPKEFQDKITVSNSKEIEELISYYEAHPQEKTDLMNRMKDYYLTDSFRENWQNEINKCILNFIS